MNKHTFGIKKYTLYFKNIYKLRIPLYGATAPYSILIYIVILYDRTPKLRTKSTVLLAKNDNTTVQKVRWSKNKLLLSKFNYKGYNEYEGSGYN